MHILESIKVYFYTFWILYMCISTLFNFINVHITRKKSAPEGTLD